MKSDAIKLFFVLVVTQIGRQRLSYKLNLKAQWVLKGWATNGIWRTCTAHIQVRPLRNGKRNGRLSEPHSMRGLGFSAC